MSVQKFSTSKAYFDCYKTNDTDKYHRGDKPERGTLKDELKVGVIWYNVHPFPCKECSEQLYWTKRDGKVSDREKENDELNRKMNEAYAKYGEEGKKYIKLRKENEMSKVYHTSGLEEDEEDFTKRWGAKPQKRTKQQAKDEK